MRRLIIPYAGIICLMLAWGGSLPAVAQTTAAPDAKEIIRRIETQYWGETSHSVARMDVVTEEYSRSMTMEMWSKGRDDFIAIIRKPVKEAGTATLRIGDEMWNYLPNIDRLLKIPSSLMGANWMGSHLTNDDLVKENKVEELYELTVESQQDSIVTILCIPKPNAAVVWGKIEYVANLERLIPVKTLYYDEESALVRTITFDDVQQVSGRWLPLRMTVVPTDKPDEKTVLEYLQIELGVKLDPDRFSIQSLRRQ